MLPMCTQIRTIFFIWWGSLVTPVHACSHMGTAGHQTSLGKVPKKWKLINIASIVRVATECLLKLSPRYGGKAMGTDHMRRGTSLPQTWLNWGKTVKTTLKIEKFMIRTPTPGTYPGFRFRRCWLNPGVSKSLDPSPSQLFSVGVL